MIAISGKQVYSKDIITEYTADSIEAKIINIISSSESDYTYTSLNQLRFELNMRKNIVASAKELNSGNMKFKIFKESFCNKKYWDRTKNGGFKLKEDVSSSEGINDIFRNSSKYGTECSTAIVILYYKAILNIYPEELFNKTFENIYLLNWHNFDDDLNVHSYEVNKDFLPGDCIYFENPDYNPEKSEWQGENAIILDDDNYYGHGIGIENADGIIKALNKHRKSNAEKSAYLSNNIARPNFDHLANIYINSLNRIRYECFRYCPFYG
jgi:protein-glutamine gamma-glutamyltransferase